MPLLVQYVYDATPALAGPPSAPAVGRILGVWQGTPVSMLTAQIPADTTDLYQPYDVDLDPRVVLHEYYILGTELTVKGVLTITANPNPFAADGVTVCQMSVTPFVPCTLLVDLTALALTEADPIAEVTSTTPKMIHVELEMMTQYRADPPFLIVEAQ